ncbi:Hypothetical predicted protein [Cloeon dipterum]|uniref:Uncharacterized protein n=1 Tax=Cloeon dipterum TaxID=197152 RepID=A0A8S1DMR5_9INSE|nr:Hypothetical predicted protein [Cloeon dipterum]
MSLQKELCLICERPTADGAVLAVHVDKEKLQEWFLNVCGHELAEEIQDEDLICYFCLWHAEFLWKFDGMSDETLVWWNLDLDDATKKLRKHYFEGNIEQCWVALEEVDLPECEEDEIDKDFEGLESEEQTNICPQKKKCLYCVDWSYICHALRLHFAALNKKHAVNITSHLVGQGLDLLKDVDGESQIYHAVRLGHFEVAEKLLANKNQLHYFVAEDKLKIVKRVHSWNEKLIEAVDPEVKNALHFAALCADLRMSNMLPEMSEMTKAGIWRSSGVLQVVDLLADICGIIS